jgi:[ribosomal protein S18]-alanine N-acetyltransferase
MRRAHLDAVCAMAEASFAVAWQRGMLEEELMREFAWCRVACRDDQVLAFSNFWIVGDELQLHHLATDTRHRRMGCASALLSDMLDIALRNGASRAYLEVRRSNQAALRLYRRFGFRSIGTRPHYYSDNQEDAIVMLCEALVQPPTVQGDEGLAAERRRWPAAPVAGDGSDL